MSKLAIIIPAYKDEFLAQTLDSFVRQTNQNFVIYIGDDNSPNDLYSIVQKYEDKLNIIYKKFENNLGSRFLTKQWERCIEMSSEEWVWLFSDDDLPHENCVQEFYKAKNEDNKFYKFNTEIIDRKNKVLKTRKIRKVQNDIHNKLHGEITSQDYINKRLLCNGFRSFAVEYIFHRSIYEKNKFIDFPLAWASDDATWLKYSIDNNKRIKILNSVVYWRYSGQNISSDVKSKKIVDAKITAAKMFVEWLKMMTLIQDIKVEDKMLIRWIAFQLAILNKRITFKYFLNIIKQLNLKSSNYDLVKNFLIIKYYHFRNRF